MNVRTKRLAAVLGAVILLTAAALLVPLAARAQPAMHDPRPLRG